MLDIFDDHPGNTDEWWLAQVDFWQSDCKVLIRRFSLPEIETWGWFSVSVN